MKYKTVYKKILVVILILSSVLSLMSGCGNEEEQYFTSIEEIKDKRISSWIGFTFDDVLKKEFPDAELLYFGDINLMVEALNSDKVEAFAYEECFQKFADKDDLGLTHLKGLEYKTSYAFAFSDTEKGVKLLNEFNTFVEKSKQNGILDKLQNEWMFSGELKSAEELNTWDTSNGTIEFATTATMAPFMYISENRLSGYEAALLIEFCKEYHYAVNVTLSSWDAMISNVISGRCDICAQSIEASEEHKKSLNMSIDTYTGNFVLFVKLNPANQPKYKSFDELHGLRTAAILGSIDEQLSLQYFPENTIVTFPIINDCVSAVLNNKADITFTDEMSADEFCNANEGLAYLQEPIYKQPLGAIFNKNDIRSQKIKEEFNEFIIESKQNGFIDVLFSKWKIHKADADKENRQFTGEPITITINATTVPYTFIKNGEPTGFEIELVEAFCEKYGYVPNYFNTNFSGLIPSITSSKSDFAIAIISYTEERAKEVDFSEIYLYDNLMILVPTKGTSKVNAFESIKRSLKRTFIDENRWKLFVSGIITTLEITLFSAIIGTALGFLIYMLCRKGSKLLNSFFDVFSRIFAGLPMVVILMILFYVVFKKSDFSGTIISIIGFGIATALNVYSSLKTAVKSIDIGQTEASYAIGFTDVQTFFRIILPQALQQFIPNYKNLLINLINGTAVVGFIAVQDLTRTSDLVRAVTYEAFVPLIATAIIYFILGVILTNIVKRIQFSFEPERRSEEQILKKYIK